MNAQDGMGQVNLRTTALASTITMPTSSHGRQIVYRTYGKQTSNPEGTAKLSHGHGDGSGKKNLTDNRGATVTLGHSRRRRWKRDPKIVKRPRVPSGSTTEKEMSR